ncbi:MAG: hypothetical protein KTR15_11330 [Phycisphaeraceae bacterium]|nr:hypothetical protein [Phycisphaeraceae bacterium]
MPEPSQGTEKLVLCPYCGHAQYGGDRCQACAGLFEPLSRRATQLAMGPWQIRDKNQPFRPGCCYDVLKSMAKAGKIKATTVMRGPTTRQFWSIARNVPGVAHLVGYCHECGNHVSPSDAKCGECNAIFQEPRDRDGLGLAYKTDDEAVLGQQMLRAEINGEPLPARQMPGPTKKTKPRPAKMDDLLSEVLDLSGDIGPSVPSSQPAAPGAPMVTPKPAAAAIDFVSPAASPQAPAPTSAFDVEPTRELPESGGVSTLGLVMIMLNIIAIATIVVIWLMLR